MSMRMSGKLPWVYAILAIVLLMAAGAVLFAIHTVAQDQNKAAVQTQQRIATSLSHAMLASLSGTLTAESYWDEGYKATVTKWNPSWIAWEYGAYLPSLDVQKSLLFNASGKAVFVHETDQVAKIGAAALSGDAGIRRLVAVVRRAPPRAESVVAQGFLTLNGQVYQAAASYVLSDKEKPSADPNKRFVLVFLRAVKAGSFAKIRDYATATGFEVRLPNDAVDDKVFVALADASGREVARLWWTPHRPGTQLLATLDPLAIGIFIGLGVVLVLIFGTWRKLTDEASEAQALALAASEESRAKTSFLASLSHDLRTPLNAIIGFSDIMRKEIRGPLGDARYVEYIGHIHSSGTHLLRIIGDLLDLAKIDAKQASLACDMNDVRAVIEEACDMIQLEADGNGIKLIRPPSHAMQLAYCDQKALLRIMTNILSNALKFTRAGGSIAVSLEADRRFANIRIVDTGIGIKQEDVMKLGRPFTQVGGHLTQHKQGTGLGLSICKGLLEVMGGDLKIESEFGVGTIVIVRVPLHAPGKPLQDNVPERRHEVA